MLVSEPTVEETIEILKGIKDWYEAHHGCSILTSFEAATNLSARYVADRFLPDKAIDLIDEAGSRVRMKALEAPKDLRELEVSGEASSPKRKAVASQEFEKASWFSGTKNRG